MTPFPYPITGHDVIRLLLEAGCRLLAVTPEAIVVARSEEEIDVPLVDSLDIELRSVLERADIDANRFGELVRDLADRDARLRRETEPDEPELLRRAR